GSHGGVPTGQVWQDPRASGAARPADRPGHQNALRRDDSLLQHRRPGPRRHRRAVQGHAPRLQQPRRAVAARDGKRCGAPTAQAREHEVLVSPPALVWF
ncbi:unnamed protein product, partial [Ectocarpus sp. 12 AP-2014]